MSSSIPPNAPSRDAIAMMQYDAAKKTPLLAYLLWFFLGAFGAHRFYLGKTGSGVAMLLIFLLSFPLAFVVIGLFGFIVIGIWWVVDAFLIPGLVDRHNEALIARFQR